MKPTKKLKRADVLEFDNKKDKNRGVQSNCLTLKIDHLKTFQALTQNQRAFFDIYKDGADFMMLSGSAGTGKTFIALYKALEEVMDKSNPYNKVIIVRSAVQLRDSGFLPGDEEQKNAIYEAPYSQICSTLFGRGDAYQRLKEQKHIQFVTTTAIRGITFDRAIVIVDECQNFNAHELDTVITRVGNYCKIIFVGDTKQNDLLKNSRDVSGLVRFMRIASNVPGFERVHFTREDIVRSDLVRDYIIACEDYEEQCGK
jgi:phosphate starvation-inducible PhoH-like protein